MNYKQLIILDISKSTKNSQNKYIFKLNNVRIKKWRIKNIYYSITNMSEKYFCHIPQLMSATINPTLQGNGQPCSIVGMLTATSNNDNDRNTLFLPVEKTFYEFDVYFTDKDGNIVEMDDFCVLLDIEKEA